MVTTIQISNDLQENLIRRKLFERETYEEIIWNALEDSSEINEQTKKELEESREQIKQGKFYKLSDIKKELKIN